MIYLSEMPGAHKKRAKYGNKKVTVDGILFDSEREAKRWMELRLLERAGVISALERQVPFELLPARRRSDGKLEKNAVYIADFTYHRDGRFIVEDAKGVRTKEYILKRKMMLAIHEIEIAEV